MMNFNQGQSKKNGLFTSDHTYKLFWEIDKNFFNFPLHSYYFSCFIYITKLYLAGFFALTSTDNPHKTLIQIYPQFNPIADSYTHIHILNHYPPFIPILSNYPPLIRRTHNYSLLTTLYPRLSWLSPIYTIINIYPLLIPNIHNYPPLITPVETKKSN